MAMAGTSAAPPICQPGEMMCQAGQLAMCNSTGDAFEMMPCPSGTQCVDPGLCAACVSDTDCAAMTRGCKVGKCVNHMCSAENADSSMQCVTSAGAPGKCASAGECECSPQCNKDCGDNGCGGTCPSKCGSTQMCVNDQCVDCTSDSDCSELNSADGCTTGTCKNGRCTKKNQGPTQCMTTDSRRARGICANGTCVCSPSCNGRCSGSDGCNGTCNEPCGSGEECGPGGTCQPKQSSTSRPPLCSGACADTSQVCDVTLHYCTNYCDAIECPAPRACVGGAACALVPPCPAGMVEVTYSGKPACANEAP
jgi:hypothetical protein